MPRRGNKGRGTRSHAPTAHGQPHPAHEEDMRGANRANRTRIRTLAGTGAAAALAMTSGKWAGGASTRWYRRLHKPAWQAPPWTFGVVWPPLYVLVAYAGARALDRAGRRRRAVRRAFTLTMALNAAWPALFFRGHRPRLALMELAALNVSNLALIARTRRADRVAAALLLPYVAWTGYATAMNAAIVRRNRGRRRG